MTMPTTEEFLKKLDELLDARSCKHEKWLGIPEVDAWCENCGMDEFEVAYECDNINNTCREFFGMPKDEPTHIKIFVNKTK